MLFLTLELTKYLKLNCSELHVLEHLVLFLKLLQVFLNNSTTESGLLQHLPQMDKKAFLGFLPQPLELSGSGLV